MDNIKVSKGGKIQAQYKCSENLLFTQKTFSTSFLNAIVNAHFTQNIITDSAKETNGRFHKLTSNRSLGLIYIVTFILS